MVYFGSQVNILPTSTWIEMGQPQLLELGVYLKRVDQELIEPIGVCKKY